PLLWTLVWRRIRGGSAWASSKQLYYAMSSQKGSAEFFLVGPPGLTANLQWNWQSLSFHQNCPGPHTTLTCTVRLKVHSCLTIKAFTTTRRGELVSYCPTLIVRVIFPAPPEDRIILVGFVDALLP